jgi:hypothetical protein
MKWNQVMVSLAFVLCMTGPAFGDASPMVERHIFMPEEQEGANPESVKEKSPEVEKLERELLFTGIIIGPDGKRAMIREKTHPRGKEAEKASLVREGDEIRGMTVKEIGSNYLVLAGQGGDVRLNLFQEGKERPAPPPEPKAAEVPAVPPTTAPGAQQEGAGDKQPVQAGQPVQPKASTKAGTPGQATRTVPPAQTAIPGQQAENPFANALKKAQQQNVMEGRRNMVNPFLDAIRRSQANKAQ